MSVHSGAYAQRASPDMVEWIIDNTKDLTLLTEMHDGVVFEHLFGNGSVEHANVGAVCLRVTNEHSEKEKSTTQSDLTDVPAVQGWIQALLFRRPTGHIAHQGQVEAAL